MQLSDVPKIACMPVETVDGIATRIRVAFVAARRLVVKVIAARALHQIAADRRHIANLPGRAEQNRLRQKRITLTHRSDDWPPRCFYRRADRKFRRPRVLRFG